MDQLRRIVTILLGVSLAAKQLSFHTVGIFMENVRTIISLMPIVDVQLGLFSRHDPPRRAEGGLMKPDCRCECDKCNQGIHCGRWKCGY